MGAFPNLSRHVPFCPRLSSFVLGARNEDKSGQKRTNGDKTGHFGTNGETPPFSIYPHLALLNVFFLSEILPFCEAIFSCESPIPERREVACKTPIFMSERGPVSKPLETGLDQFFHS